MAGESKSTQEGQEQQQEEGDHEQHRPFPGMRDKGNRPASSGRGINHGEPFWNLDKYRMAMASDRSCIGRNAGAMVSEPLESLAVAMAMSGYASDGPVPRSPGKT
jgi:hypothetical protein